MDSDTFGTLMDEAEKTIEELLELTRQYKFEIGSGQNRVRSGPVGRGSLAELISLDVYDCLIRILRKQHGLIVKLENELSSKK